MSFILSAVKIIFLLGFLIFIHEGGHFTIAKICKVKVNQFAIGFGPAIFEHQGKETKYTIRLIPLGGFVSMEGENGESNHERSFQKATILQRLAIVVARTNYKYYIWIFSIFCVSISNLCGFFLSN